MPSWILLAGLSLLFVGATVAIVVGGAIGREKAEISASLAAIESISGPIPEDMRREYDKPFSERVTKPAQEWMANLALTLSGSNWARNATRRLGMAGNPPRWDAERILAAKTLCLISLGGATACLLLVSGRGVQALVWAAAFGAIGFFIPDVALANAAQKRSEEVRRALPDSIDLLTISVESGLAFDAAVAQVARNTDGPLADEFTRVLKEIQIGSSRSDALRGLAERTDVDDLRVFLNSMIQAEKLGIPIADVLRVQTSEIRVRRSQRIEEQAMKLPVKILFPLMVGIMPAMFIVILGPAALRIMDLMAAS